MILSISGVSGSGKTTLANYILNTLHRPRAYMLQSVTTRASRVRDIPGEFLHLSLEEFKKKTDSGEFLWVTKPIHGIRYGTLKQSVEYALESSDLFLMIIAIDQLAGLLNFADRNPNKISAVYINSPSEKMLRKRLEARGEADEDINKRIKECSGWDKIAHEQFLDSKIVKFVDNNGTLTEFFESFE